MKSQVRHLLAAALVVVVLAVMAAVAVETVVVHIMAPKTAVVSVAA